VQQPTGDALSTQAIYQKAVDWVVLISITEQYGGGRSSSGTATGVIYSSDGYIITNNHVVENAVTITVTTQDGKDYDAKVVGADPHTDIAVVKIEANGLNAAEFGASGELLPGDPAIVIGNPLGAEYASSITQGVISAPVREIQQGRYIMSLIQIDAAINPGNSGGPLLNAYGQVVGIVSSKIAATDVEGIGFAIPSDVALQVAEDFIQNGGVLKARPVLGISVSSFTPEQAQFYNARAGLIVQEIVEGGSADQGGMKVGDEILKFNGVAVATSTELNYEKNKCAVGDTVTVTVKRDGQTIDLEITLQSERS